MMDKKKKFLLLFGGTVAFTPTSIASLEYWGDASDLTQITKDGSNRVSSFTDKSGKGHTAVQAVNGSKPIYTAAVQNSLSGFVCDGVAQVLEAPKIAALQNITKVSLFMVSKRGVFGHGQDNNHLTAILHYSADDNVYSLFSNSGAQTYEAPTVAPGNIWNYTSVVIDLTQATDATKVKMWVNGVAQTLAFTGAVPAATEAGTSLLTIGGTGVGVGQGWFAGTFGEGLIFTDALGTTDRVNVQNFLKSKWGL